MARDDPGGRADAPSAGAARRLEHSLLIGYFDPIDVRAITEILRLSCYGPVRAVVLGEAFARTTLTSAQDRAEVVGFVRGVDDVIVVRDRRQLESVLRGADHAVVAWLDDVAVAASRGHRRRAVSSVQSTA